MPRPYTPTFYKTPITIQQFPNDLSKESGILPIAPRSQIDFMQLNLPSFSPRQQKAAQHRANDRGVTSESSRGPSARKGNISLGQSRYIYRVCPLVYQARLSV